MHTIQIQTLTAHLNNQTYIASVDSLQQKKNEAE